MKVWLKGLAAAVIGAAATGATQAIGNSGALTKQTGITAAVAGLISLFAYLMKSPLPGVQNTPPSGN